MLWVPVRMWLTATLCPGELICNGFKELLTRVLVTKYIVLISFCTGFSCFLNNSLWILVCPLQSSWHIFHCRAYLVMKKLDLTKVTWPPQSPTTSFWPRLKTLVSWPDCGEHLPSGPPFGSDEEDWWGFLWQALVWFFFNGLYFHLSRKTAYPFLAKYLFWEKPQTNPPSPVYKNEPNWLCWADKNW